MLVVFIILLLHCAPIRPMIQDQKKPYFFTKNQCENIFKEPTVINALSNINNFLTISNINNFLTMTNDDHSNSKIKALSDLKELRSLVQNSTSLSIVSNEDVFDYYMCSFFEALKKQTTHYTNQENLWHLFIKNELSSFYERLMKHYYQKNSKITLHFIQHINIFFDMVDKEKQKNSKIVAFYKIYCKNFLIFPAESLKKFHPLWDEKNQIAFFDLYDKNEIKTAITYPPATVDHEKSQQKLIKKEKKDYFSIDNKLFIVEKACLDTMYPISNLPKEGYQSIQPTQDTNTQENILVHKKLLNEKSNDIDLANKESPYQMTHISTTIIPRNRTNQDEESLTPLLSKTKFTPENSVKDNRPLIEPLPVHQPSGTLNNPKIPDKNTKIWIGGSVAVSSFLIFTLWYMHKYHKAKLPFQNQTAF